MKQTTRTISKQELEMVNPIIRQRLGATKVIESGTVVEDSEGKTYFIVVRERHTTYSDQIKKIGKIVKEKLNAQKVYYFETQIA